MRGSSHHEVDLQRCQPQLPRSLVGMQRKATSAEIQASLQKRKKSTKKVFQDEQ